MALKDLVVTGKRPPQFERPVRYPLEPRRLHENAWFYEEKAGLRVVQELRTPKDGYIGTAQILIPWRQIEAACETRAMVKEQRKWAGRKLKSKP